MGTKEVAAIGGLAKFSMYLNLFFGVFFGNILFYLATIKYIFFLWGLAFSIIFFDFSCAGFLFGSCPTHPQMQYFHYHIVFFSPFRYEIEAVRRSLLAGEMENSTMPQSTTERIFRWMDEIRRQIGVVYKEDIQTDVQH